MPNKRFFSHSFGDSSSIRSHFKRWNRENKKRTKNQNKKSQRVSLVIIEFPNTNFVSVGWLTPHRRRPQRNKMMRIPFAFSFCAPDKEKKNILVSYFRCRSFHSRSQQAGMILFLSQQVGFSRNKKAAAWDCFLCEGLEMEDSREKVIKTLKCLLFIGSFIRFTPITRIIFKQI